VTDVITSDGVRLYAEATGTASGLPVLFIHEFAADHRTWSRQVDALSGTFRCITYASRGYPPSEVPPEQERYNYLRQADDAIDVLDACSARCSSASATPTGSLRCWWRVRVAEPAPVAESPS
jgi:pimeloyl-ACP methyl ester carboxylesterase